MDGNVVIVHNFDLVVTVEAIHDALDIDGLALVGGSSDNLAVIAGHLEFIRDGERIAHGGCRRGRADGGGYS